MDTKQVDGLKMNIEKLGRYFTVEMRIRNKNSGPDPEYTFINHFRNCKLKDFTNRGLVIDNKSTEGILKNRMCPDMDILKK